MAGVTPRGVLYTLRSVLRGLSILNAHFTGVYILQRGMFLCLFFSEAVEGRERRTGRCKHPRFLFVVGDKVFNHLTLGVCQNKRKEQGNKK